MEKICLTPQELYEQEAPPPSPDEARDEGEADLGAEAHLERPAGGLVLEGSFRDAIIRFRRSFRQGAHDVQHEPEYCIG